MSIIDETKDVNLLKVEKSHSFLIVSFAFSKDYKNAIQAINLNRWQAEEVNPLKLFQHIDALISCDTKSNSSIGCRFVMKSDGETRTSYGLPKNTTAMLTYNGNSNETFKFSIKGVELFLFETQVGFIVFKLGYEKNTILDNIIGTTYFVKKLLLCQDKISYVKDTLNNVSEHVNLCSMVTKIANNFGNAYFFEGKEDIPEQALVFNAAVLDKEPEDNVLKEYLYRMRRSFKESYRPAPAEFDIENNPEVFRPFENNYWGVALEGLANLSYKVGNNKTDSFFTGNYFGNLESTYFYVYMLALHQRFALLHLSILASRLKVSDSYYELDQINSLKKKIILFTLRCAFKHVTGNTHQAKLYEMIRSSLHIEELMTELQFELEILSSVAELENQKMVEREKEKEETAKAQAEEKRNRFSTLIVFITTIFVMISTSNDALSISNNINQHNFPNISSRPFTLLAVLVLGIWSIGLYVLLNFVIKVLWHDSKKNK